MKIKNAILAALVASATVVALPSRADTLTLESTGGASVGGEQIYPYYFSVNGSSTLTSLMCIDLNRTITYGESWNVTDTALPMDNSSDSTTYRADAWIFGQLGTAASSGTYSATDVQLAAWDLFDPSGATALGMTANATTLAGEAMAEANNSTLINDGYFAQFAILLPTDNTASDYANGSVPQRFIGLSSNLTPTPEPSSLLLLGTGLLGMGGKLYRRRR